MTDSSVNSMEELKSYFDNKFSEFRRELLIPKPENSNNVFLNKKGHQKQLEFNKSLQDIVYKITGITDPISGADVLELCTQLEEKLRHRNKLIRLADKSPGGWATVSEYEQDDLATDPDDSKRIKQAEKAALLKINERMAAKKASAEKKTFFPPRPSPYRFPTPAGNFPQPQIQPFLGYSDAFRRPRFSNTFFGARATDQCFACGKFGHFRMNCPHDPFNVKPPSATGIPYGSSADKKE